MIDKSQAREKGINIIETRDLAAKKHFELIEKLKALVPNIVNSDNILNTAALEDLIDLSETTANNCGYELTFAGKGLAKAKAETPTELDLKAEQGQSKNFENTGNTVLRGDNLDILKTLRQNYTDKIKMIYIDPPYNTKSENFVYRDNFKVNAAQLIEEFGLEEETANYLTSIYGTRSHSGWLAFMYPRLKIARELLREDGVIFISIDDHEQASLKILCDEIFGEDNFVANIVWRKTDNQANIGDIARVKEYILVYVKSEEYLNLNKMELTERAKKEYRYKDEYGTFRRSILLDKTRGRHIYEVETPSGNILNGPWMVTEEKFKELEQNNSIYWATGGDESPHGKLYLHDSNGQISSDWLGIEYGTNQQASTRIEELFNFRIFEFSKPTSLIQHFLTIATNREDDDLILDFFAGSGTTGEAVMQLNAEDGGKRRFILAQLDEEISDSKPAYKFCIDNNLESVISSITIERLRRAGEKIIAEKPELAQSLDTGYKVFSLQPKRKIVEDSHGALKIENMGMHSVTDRLYNMLCASSQDINAPIETIEAEALYKSNNAFYVLSNFSARSEDFRDHRVFIDGYADISLENILNLGLFDNENVSVIY